MGITKTLQGWNGVQIRFAVILFFGLFAGLFALTIDTTAGAATTLPTKMNFQGRITNSAGNILANGTYNMRFKIWSAASGGTQQWSEDRLVSAAQGVTVTNGQFSVQLGSITSLPASVFASSSLYFEVELPTPASATTSSPVWIEGPMTPRNQLATSAYAYNSETLDGLDSAAFGQLDQNNVFTGNNTFNGTLQGGSSLTLGTVSAQGSLVLNDGSGQTGTLVMANTAGNYTYTIPVTTANDTFCLQALANCVAGVSTIGSLDGGTANSTGASIVGSTLYLQSASATNAGLVNTTSQSFAGDKTFNGALSIGGAINQTNTKLSLTGSLPTGTNYYPREMDVVGNYTYMIGQGADGPLTIVDVTNPSSPVVIGTLSSNPTLNGARDIRVIGKYAYVATLADRFVVVDVSNPSSPTIVGSVTDNVNLDQAHGVDVQGKYAYVTATNGANGHSDGYLTAIDISNPASPTVVGVLNHADLREAKQVDVNGKYAYVTSGATTSGGLVIVDISNPTAPTRVSSLLSTNTRVSRDVVMNGRYAYIVSASTDTMSIIDVSNPGTPTLVGQLTDSTNMDEPYDVTLNGKYAYVASNTSGNVAVVNISNPASPSIVSGAGYSFAGLAPTAAQLNGRYLYVNTNDFNPANVQLRILDTGGTSLMATEANTIHTQTIQVEGSADVADTLNVGDSVSVGQGGIRTDGNFVSQGSGYFAGTIQGGSSLTLGSTTAEGSLVLNDGSGQTGTIRMADTAGNFVYTVPVTTANDTFCLVALANCTGGGGSGTLQDAYNNSASPATITTTAAKGVSIVASAIPTANMLSVSNAGQGVTTAGINGINVNYVGGNAAVESGGIRVDLTPGGTNGGTWNGMRVVANSVGPVSGVNMNGIKIDGPSSQGAGTETGLYIGTGWDIGMDLRSGGMQFAAMSDPSTPTANNLRVYTKAVSGRLMLKVKAPSGVDYALQPALFQQQVTIATPGITATTISALGNGIPVLTGTGAASTTTQAKGATNRVTSAATIGSGGGVQTTTPGYYRGSGGNNADGFFYYVRLNFSDVLANYTNATTGARFFAGLSSLAITGTGSMVASDTPTGDFAGFQYSAVRDTGGNFQFITRNNATQTTANTGVALAVSKTYDFSVYAAPGDSTIYWRIVNLTDGVTTEGSTSSTLPTATTAMRIGFAIAPLTATAKFLDWQRLYGESDR